MYWERCLNPVADNWQIVANHEVPDIAWEKWNNYGAGIGSKRLWRGYVMADLYWYRLRFCV
jgi:hypothetical protein